MAQEEIEQKPVPEVGKLYHFWDDGKTGPSRHYICRVEELIKPEDAKKVVFDDVPDEGQSTSLYDIWRREVDEHRQTPNFTVISIGTSIEHGAPWLYAESTDFFVRINCPNYDDNDLWAVRTVDGGWFTMDIQSWWQGGRLDVTGEIYDNIITYYETNNYDTHWYKDATYEKKGNKE